MDGEAGRHGEEEKSRGGDWERQKDDEKEKQKNPEQQQEERWETKGRPTRTMGSGNGRGFAGSGHDPEARAVEQNSAPLEASRRMPIDALSQDFMVL